MIATVTRDLLTGPDLADVDLDRHVSLAPPELILALAVERVRALRADRLRAETLTAERAARRLPPPLVRTEAEIVAEYQERAVAAEKLQQKLSHIMDDYASELRTEWTRELLDSVLSLPDGSHVTWGSATIAQHRLRLDMFRGQAHAALEGAARHMQAIAALESAGALCLDGLLDHAWQDAQHAEFSLRP